MADLDRDSIASRISPECSPPTQQILTAAWAHDVQTVKKLLDEPGRASSQDSVTGETPLHAAVRACGEPSDDDTPEDLENAKTVVHELLLWGAIWNDVDDHNETPGCVARRLQRPELYNLCVEAGVRAELLFALMGGYEELSSGEEEEDDGPEAIEVGGQDGNGVIEDGDEAPELVAMEANNGVSEEQGQEPEQEKETKFVRPSVNSADYLRSSVTYTEGKLVDDDGNGVMMAWETDIMRKSVDALIPDKAPGKRILNVGFGMGIIDGMFAEMKPSRHHIIEAHPEVLKYISTPESKFGASWEASGGEPGAFKVHHGKWQDICPKLIEEGQVFDAIYFDTFGEDYSQMRMFFTEYVPGLLDPHGIFGFFNGLGADRPICYDVYTKVVEIHLTDAGLDVDWNVIDVDMKNLAEDGKGDWEGVKMRYWTLDKYRLPICTFLG
ncbi:arginine N-methyltransferase 2 [Thozetella sp. PMI_491]|nr:arginine N-methyltransferase 2 [Thozetella sp. PMI_491]